MEWTETPVFGKDGKEREDEKHWISTVTYYYVEALQLCRLLRLLNTRALTM